MSPIPIPPTPDNPGTPGNSELRLVALTDECLLLLTNAILYLEAVYKNTSPQDMYDAARVIWRLSNVVCAWKAMPMEGGISSMTMKQIRQDAVDTFSVLSHKFQMLCSQVRRYDVPLHEEQFRTLRKQSLDFFRVLQENLLLQRKHYLSKYYQVKNLRCEEPPTDVDGDNSDDKVKSPPKSPAKREHDSELDSKIADELAWILEQDCVPEPYCTMLRDPYVFFPALPVRVTR